MAWAVNSTSIFTAVQNDTVNLNKAVRCAKELIHTLTFDNGKEFAWFKELEQAFDAKAYFCHPYSSWEKGSIENMNGFISRYVSKGANILELTQEYLNEIAEKLNNRPRKVLGYRVPNQVFHAGQKHLNSQQML